MGQSAMDAALPTEEQGALLRRSPFVLKMVSLLVGCPADWVILVTSLPRETFPAEDVLALYRLRWRIELPFKRLKSLIGLHGPPGSDPRSAKP